MQIQNKVIVITGGGNGMGRALTLQLLKKGAKVAIVDIDQKGMEDTFKMAGKLDHNLSTHTLDITNREQVNALPQTIIRTHGGIDGLINNAGIIQPFVRVEALDKKTIDRIMNINFYGTVNMVKAFLPELLKRPEAHITNISSMGGFISFPGQTIYSASKAAVKVFTEGLNAELKDTNVGVTTILPGAVRTKISEHSGVQARASEESSSMPMLEPEKAAEFIIRAIEKNKFRALVGKDAKFLDAFYRLNPRWAVHYIAKQMKDLIQ